MERTVVTLDRIVREPECLNLTGLSRSTRWRREREGTFPKRRRLGPNCSGWLLSEILEWIEARAPQQLELFDSD